MSTINITSATTNSLSNHHAVDGWDADDSYFRPRSSDATGTSWEDSETSSYDLLDCSKTIQEEDEQQQEQQEQEQEGEDETDTSKSALDARLKEELNSVGLRGSMHLKTRKSKSSSVIRGAIEREEDTDYMVALLVMVAVPSLIVIGNGGGDTTLKHFESVWEFMQQLDHRWFVGASILMAMAIVVWMGQFDADPAKELKTESTIYGLIQLAEQRDVKSMEWMGHNYHYGLNGFAKDYDKSYMWYDRAAKAGSNRGMAMVGELLVKELVSDKRMGKKKQHAKGFMYLGIAAEKGSDVAAFTLGKAHARGIYGTYMDKCEAIYWLEKVTNGSCTDQHLDEHSKHEAEDILDELTKKRPL